MDTNVIVNNVMNSIVSQIILNNNEHQTEDFYNTIIYTDNTSDNKNTEILDELIEELILSIEYKDDLSIPISHRKYHYVVNSIRLFMIEEGMIECNPFNYKISKSNIFIPDFNYHILLETQLLEHKHNYGFFIINNNCCEIIIRTDNDVLLFVQKMLIYLSYNKNNTCHVRNYKYLADKTGQTEIKINDYFRRKIYEKFGAVFILDKFPDYLSDNSIFIEKNNNFYNKICVFLSGLECINGCQLIKDKTSIINYIKINNSERSSNHIKHLLDFDWEERIYLKINIKQLILSMTKESLIPDLFL